MSEGEGRTVEEARPAAGAAGIAGGVGLAIVSIVHNAVGLDPETADPGANAEAASLLAHGVAYGLMLAALAAALGARRAWFGRVARVAAWALVVALAALAVVFLVGGAAWLAGADVDMEAWYFLPAPIGFALMFLAALVLGIALLLRRSAPWAVPALMVATVPAAVVTALLDTLAGVSLTAAAVEVPLYLAFAVLGYELLRRPAPPGEATPLQPAPRRGSSGSSAAP